MTGKPHQPMNFENANPGAEQLANLGAIVATRGNAGLRSRGGSLLHRIFNTDGSVWPGQDSGFLGSAPIPGSELRARRDHVPSSACQPICRRVGLKIAAGS